MSNALSRYMHVGFRDVAGWLSELAVATIAKLSQSQHEAGVNGPACEIGVHRGKLFILLHLLTKPGEHSVAWDLFERQSENIDKSGHGDKQIFLANLRDHGGDPERVSAVTANSLELTVDKIVAECRGRVRVFSIDGGHTAHITYNDLKLAQPALCKGGIVILDDFFNENWPGVSEGALKFLSTEPHDLTPVVIAGNKFIFTNDANLAARYRASLAELHQIYNHKLSEFLGQEVLVLTQPWRSLKDRLGITRLLRAGRA